MRNEGLKAILDPEELIIQRKMKDSICPGKTDLWPAIRKEIFAGDGEKHSAPFFKRAWIPAAVMLLAVGLMGAGILNHWFVYDSNGNKTTLAETESFSTGDEFVSMKPAAETEAESELYHPYDWVDQAEIIPGGLQIPGNTAEERNIPALREMLSQLAPGTYTELRVNGTIYTAVQGCFTTDYEECKKSALGNVLGIRMPDASSIPADYSEHLSFTTGYYLTSDDFAAKEELTADETEQYELKTYQVPGAIEKQIGWYALQWFKSDKSPIICTAHLAENDEWLIPTTDENDDVKALTINGFEKALYWEHKNAAYDAQEINIMLWQKIDPVSVMELGYTASPEAAERRYIVYSLDAVGISEEDAIKIAEALTE